MALSLARHFASYSQYDPMKVYDFDIKRGRYLFEVDDLIAEKHAHPAVELIMATEGSFNLTVGDQEMHDVFFAIVDRNRKHALQSKAGVFDLLMLESNNRSLMEFLEIKGIGLSNGYYSASENRLKCQSLFKEIDCFSKENNLKTPDEARVAQCISIIEHENIAYSELMTALPGKIYLSESRISHLFKEHMGLSLKKYLVWNKLRKAMKLYLDTDQNLSEVSFNSGFFDSAHLSRAFKQLLGMSPSTEYNSRTVQV